MNPKTKNALANLLHDMLGAPTKEMGESACEAIRIKSKLFLEVIRDEDKALPPVEQMKHVIRSIQKWREGGGTPLSVDVIIEAVLSVALWAAAHKKTMDEGLEVYCARMMEECK